MRAPKLLVVRAGLSRTFGSIAGFVPLGLSLRVYLLSDAFAHPVDAEAAGVMGAAFVIAMAVLLLVFCFQAGFPEILQCQRTFVERSRIRPRTPSPAQARGIAGK